MNNNLLVLNFLRLNKFKRILEKANQRYWLKIESKKKKQENSKSFQKKYMKNLKLEKPSFLILVIGFMIKSEWKDIIIDVFFLKKEFNINKKDWIKKLITLIK